MSAHRQITPTTVPISSGGSQGAPKRCNSQRTVLKGDQRDPGAYPAEMEIESFIHGAMCISYSGRCLLSNFLQDGMRIREPVRTRAAGNIRSLRRRGLESICRSMKMSVEPIFSTQRSVYD